MTKLTDTQAVILSAAAQRDSYNVLPLPGALRGGAATKVVETMIAKGFIEEVDADVRKGELVWRETGDGHGTTLVTTRTGLAAIGMVPDASDSPTNKGAPTDTGNTASTAESDAKTRTPRQGTKQAKLIEMLRAEGGATIAEIVSVTGWQPHTVRGAIAGALKKKLGLKVSSEKVDGRGRVYGLPK